MTEQDIAVLFNIADMIVELIESLRKLTTNEWMQADERIAEIIQEITPILDAYQARWGRVSADERSPYLIPAERLLTIDVAAGQAGVETD